MMKTSMKIYKNKTKLCAASSRTRQVTCYYIQAGKTSRRQGKEVFLFTGHKYQTSNLFLLCMIALELQYQVVELT